MLNQPDEITIRRIVDAAIAHDRTQHGRDPYRGPLQYLVGVTTLCLGLIVAIVTALVSDHATDKGSPVSAMLGGVLAWICVSLCLAVVFIAAVQVLKWSGRDRGMVTGRIAAVLLALSALPSLAVALRGAAALVGAPPASGTLPPLLDSIGVLAHLL